MLARCNEISRTAGELTLNALLDAVPGLYDKAGVNLSGVAAAIEIPTGLGYLPAPMAPVEKFVELYYRKALSTHA
ncbi:MAG: hypothetical protein M3N35_06075 [Candidatus Binatota bacterium]|nr:hypothetical protein [Candidatus Binatota bacterium]